MVAFNTITLGYLVLLLNSWCIWEVICKPRIVGAGRELTVQRGQNVSLQCLGTKNLNWYKLVNNTQGPSVVDEESRTSYISLEIPDYVDWPDHRENSSMNVAVLNLHSIKEEESGVYVCCYENANLFQIKQRIIKNKTKYFSTIKITVIVVKPTIDEGSEITANPGQDLNVTCRGERPVTWVFLTNITSGKQHTEVLVEKKHTSLLELKNINYTDVGYFLCTFSDVSKNVYEDFDHRRDMNTASIYLFVKDTNHLLTMSGVHHINAQISTELVIPCKPTFPQVQVELVTINSAPVKNQMIDFDSKRGFLIKGVTIALEGLWNCIGAIENKSENVLIIIKVSNYNPMLPSTNVTVEGAWQINLFLNQSYLTYDVIQGDVLIIKCSSDHKNALEAIKWTTPYNESQNASNVIEEFMANGKIQQTRFITDVSTRRDSGSYSCYVTNNHVNSTAYEFSLNVLLQESTHLEVTAQSPKIILKREPIPKTIVWIIFFRSYPGVTLNWFFQGKQKVRFVLMKEDIDHVKPMVKREDQHEIKVKWSEGLIILKIFSPTIQNVGEYILVAENIPNKTLVENISMIFIVEKPPSDVKLSFSPQDIVPMNEHVNILCSAYGYPLSELSVYFISCHAFNSCDYERITNIETTRYNEETKKLEENNTSLITGLKEEVWEATAKIQGLYFCAAKNVHGAKNSSRILFPITDSKILLSKYLQIEIVINGILKEFVTSINVIEGDEVKLTCRGNTIMTFLPLAWDIQQATLHWALVGSKDFMYQGKKISILDSKTKYSYVSEMKTTAAPEMDGLKITCSDSSNKGQRKTLRITVTEAMPPVWTSEALGQAHVTKNENEQFSLLCSGTGIPDPEVKWYKDGGLIHIDESDKRITLTRGNITFAYLFPEDSGKYSCQVENRVGTLNDYVTLTVQDPDAMPSITLFACIGIISIILLLVVVVLTAKIYRENRRNRVLKVLKRRMFDHGNPDSLNPDLDLGEQADLLPYDSRFEFSKERIIFDKIIGSGAFGNVFKASASNIVQGERKTTVAVKMMKSCSDDSQMKALSSELKIMIHIGRHINIVNLLGACSRNMVSKGELLLIVEYCRHGSILEYMRRHRLEFLEQINNQGKMDAITKHKMRDESNLEGSRTSFLPVYAELDMDSSTSHSSKVCTNSFVDLNGHSEAEPSIPNGITIADTELTEKNSYNYVSDLLMAKRPSFCAKTLLHWSYQIANGMFYLSERKVIHGDLAARNILLADRNIVKISDFGLSKNIYKQENYKKKSKGPLPIKWLALEAVRDNIFSTQSDVWSFGVVLWEIFTLGQNPYAAVEVDHHFIERLEEGYRLKQPPYSTLKLFEIMEDCWQEDPNLRPLFKELEKKLGDILGDTDRQVYLTLNAQYEGENECSEHVKLIRTPTYDSRVQGLFTSNLGYELPITTLRPGIIMEENNEVFQLQPVPKGKKYDIQPDQRERQSLVTRDSEDYMIMRAPSLERMHNQYYTPEHSHTRDNHLILYQNAHFLMENRHQDRKVRTMQCRVSTSKDMQQVFPLDPQEEADDCEDDSVFPSSSNQDLHYTSDVFHSYSIQSNAYPNSSGTSELTIPVLGITTNNPEDGLDVVRKSSQHEKHDSGIYCPNSLQHNPLYSDSTNKIKINRKQHRDENSIIRTQSESSSGFGSLIEERNSSLEKIYEFKK